LAGCVNLYLHLPQKSRFQTERDVFTVSGALWSISKSRVRALASSRPSSLACQSQAAIVNPNKVQPAVKFLADGKEWQTCIAVIENAPLAVGTEVMSLDSSALIFTIMRSALQSSQCNATYVCVCVCVCVYEI